MILPLHYSLVGLGWTYRYLLMRLSDVNKGRHGFHSSMSIQVLVCYILPGGFTGYRLPTTEDTL